MRAPERDIHITRERDQNREKTERCEDAPPREPRDGAETPRPIDTREREKPSPPRERAECEAILNVLRLALGQGGAGTFLNSPLTPWC